MNDMISMDFASAEQRVMASMFDGLKMTSREIAEVTGKEHYNVIRDIKVLITQGAINALNFEVNDYKIKVGFGFRMGEEYVLDFFATYVLILGYDAKRRAAVIKRWMELEDERERAKKPVVQLPDFTNPAAAARAWADEVEAKQVLQIKIEEDAPKVAYAEAVGDTNGCLTLTQTAKSFKLGPVKFIEFLRATNRLFRRGNENLPIQDYVDSGVFKVKTIPIKNGNALATQTLVTGKGQRLLLAHVRKHQATGNYSWLI